MDQADQEKQTFDAKTVIGVRDARAWLVAVRCAGFALLAFECVAFLFFVGALFQVGKLRLFAFLPLTIVSAKKIAFLVADG